ncbi:hypothetical protein [Lactococcus phage 1358]|uniref:Uncharacterized protein n=1 Tax=Lactococcus phage 1358 TaxID=741942 RepID=D3W0G3_9CAUD|nr:hypothetical protein ABG43_gp32 [Lactococcus phage 1358]ADD25729.1 hypothetical protein [Lactococcus phage 1358]
MYKGTERAQDGSGRTRRAANQAYIKQTQNIERAALLGGGLLLGKMIGGSTKAAFGLTKFAIKWTLIATAVCVVAYIAFWVALAAGVGFAAWWIFKKVKKAIKREDLDESETHNGSEHTVEVTTTDKEDADAWGDY